MTAFTIYPAIDLRLGKVVRLAQGDPNRQKVYGYDPAAIARRWMDAGAQWLHVVNLDAAFGEADTTNHQALEAILREAQGRVQVQFGGGLRTLDAIQQALEAGVSRVVVGTAAVEHPEILKQAIAQFGADRVAAGVDARDGQVRVRGWQQGTQVSAVDLALQLKNDGLRWLVFTDVNRDGLANGLNLSATRALMKKSGLQVIASGGVASLEDIRLAASSGLTGVIIGRALYEGAVNLQEALLVNNKAVNNNHKG